VGFIVALDHRPATSANADIGTPHLAIAMAMSVAFASDHSITDT